MLDLEDIGASVHAPMVLPPPLVWRHRASSQILEVGTPAAETFLPETCTIWIKTFGCSHNISDGEYMAGQLQEYGFRQAFVRLGTAHPGLG